MNITENVGFTIHGDKNLKFSDKESVNHQQKFVECFLV